MKQKNKKTPKLADILYSADGGIGKTLAAVYRCHINVAPDDMYAILRYAKAECALYSQTILSGAEEPLPNLISHLSAIIDSIPDNQRAYAMDILHELIAEPQFTRLVNIYQILQDNWAQLNGLSITYELLVDLALIDNWRDTDSAKAQLLVIINRIDGV